MIGDDEPSYFSKVQITDRQTTNLQNVNERCQTKNFLVLHIKEKFVKLANIACNSLQKTKSRYNVDPIKYIFFVKNKVG